MWRLLEPSYRYLEYPGVHYLLTNRTMVEQRRIVNKRSVMSIILNQAFDHLIMTDALKYRNELRKCIFIMAPEFT